MCFNKKPFIDKEKIVDEWIAKHRDIYKKRWEIKPYDKELIKAENELGVSKEEILLRLHGIGINNKEW